MLCVTALLHEILLRDPLSILLTGVQLLHILLDVHIDLLVALVLLKELSELLPSARCNPEI